MMVLLLACVAAGCTSAWIVFMLFGPVPSPRRPLVVPRLVPTMASPPVSAATVPEAWFEPPTLADATPFRSEPPIVQPVLRRPRFVEPRAFDVEERTRLDY
jgi:hypothetical protein